MSKSEPGAVPSTEVVKRENRRSYESRTKVVCVDCGEERTVGDYPFCKGGHRGRGGGGYDKFVKYVDPNILPPEDPRACHEGTDASGRKVKGALIESREQRRYLMKEQNLEWAGRPIGEGGSEV